MCEFKLRAEFVCVANNAIGAKTEIENIGVAALDDVLATARLRERNLAVEKPTIQSTTYNNNHPSRAVDGVVDLQNPSCTLNGIHSWWAVDLAEPFLVQRVIVSTDSNAGMGDGFYTF